MLKEIEVPSSVVCLGVNTFAESWVKRLTILNPVSPGAPAGYSAWYYVQSMDSAAIGQVPDRGVYLLGN